MNIVRCQSFSFTIIKEGSIYCNTVNIHRTVWKIREVLLGNPYHVMPIITILVVYELSSEYFSLIILK